MFYPNLRKRGLRPERAEYFYPPAARVKAKDNFSRNLDRVIQLLSRERVPLILCAVESNVRDEAPEGSVHGRRLGAGELGRWEEFFSRGELAYSAGNFGEALRFFEEAARLDNGYALLRYRLGKSLLALGRPAEAEPELRAAIDLGDMPIQAQSFIDPLIRAKGAPGRVAIADVPAALKAAEAGGVPGDDWFLDRVHPALAGHRLIAKLVLQTMAENRLVPAGPDEIAAADAAAAEAMKRIEPEFLFQNYFYLATENEYLGRIRKAMKLSMRALAYKPDDELTRVMMLKRLEDRYGSLDTYE